MARSLHNAKLFSALVVDGLPHAITRHMFSSAAQGVASTTRRGGASAVSTVAEKSDEGAVRKAEKASSSWVPDPKTGYYKPENTKVSQVTDPAELRAVFLTKKDNINN